VWDTLTAWRREINAGTLTGPRIVASGPYLEGGPVPIPHILVRAPGDAKSAVDRLAAMRTDFIKVHGQLTRENYFAIARAARAKGIPFVGHLPRTVSAAEASDSGQRSLEHLLRIPNQCAVGDSARLAPRFPIQSVFGECTRRDLGPLFSRFVRNDTWIVPTLVAAFDIATWPKRVLPGDAYAHYLPDTLRRYVAAVFPMPPNIPADADVVGRELFQKRVSIVGAMHRAGVPIMTGTDAPLPNSPPGFGLHHELELFVEAGFSPHAALRAATSAPARFLHASDSLGTIERSKVADLVLLDANPLDDIRNTRRTVYVMANGRLFEVQRDARRAFVALVSR
jgi:hypothetical protein